MSNYKKISRKIFLLYHKIDNFEILTNVLQTFNRNVQQKSEKANQIMTFLLEEVAIFIYKRSHAGIILLISILLHNFSKKNLEPTPLPKKLCVSEY